MKISYLIRDDGVEVWCSSPLNHLHGVMPGTVGSVGCFFFAGEFMREGRRGKKKKRRKEGVTINANKTGRRAGSRAREVELVEDWQHCSRMHNDIFEGHSEAPKKSCHEHYQCAKVFCVTITYFVAPWRT